MDINYTSPHYTDLLNKYIGSQEEIDFSKKKETKDYTVDFGKRLVTRRY